MAENSPIEWTTHTANLWWGCTEVHAGCDHCYARTFARRVGKADGWDGVRYATRGIWNELLQWDSAARQAGRVDRVFCGSMMDIFEKSMPVTDWHGNHQSDAETGQLRARYFSEVVPATPNLMHLLLTKRPSNIAKMVPSHWLERWPSNVMTGTSPVDQDTADTLIPQLLRVPGPHFLSVEPLLGPVDLRSHLYECCGCPVDDTGGEYMGQRESVRSCCGNFERTGLDWVIVGGESGPSARPMHPEWARSLRDQCAAAGVPFLFKQWGEWTPGENVERQRGTVDTAFLTDDRWDIYPLNLATDGGHIDDQPDLYRVGKKAAGRLLDGVAHDGFPASSAVPFGVGTAARSDVSPKATDGA